MGSKHHCKTGLEPGCYSTDSNMDWNRIGTGLEQDCKPLQSAPCMSGFIHGVSCASTLTGLQLQALPNFPWNARVAGKNPSPSRLVCRMCGSPLEVSNPRQVRIPRNSNGFGPGLRHSGYVHVRLSLLARLWGVNQRDTQTVRTSNLEPALEALCPARAWRSQTSRAATWWWSAGVRESGSPGERRAHGTGPFCRGLSREDFRVSLNEAYGFAHAGLTGDARNL